MNYRELKEHVLWALDSSRSLTALGTAFNEIFSGLDHGVGGDISKDKNGREYLRMESVLGRQVVIRRAEHKRVKPLSPEEADEVSRSGVKTPSDQDTGWEASPLTREGLGRAFRTREAITDLIVVWFLGVEKSGRQPRPPEPRTASEEPDDYWLGGWDDEPDPPAPSSRDYSQNSPSDPEPEMNSKQTLSLILKGVEVGQFPPEIAQRIVAYALDHYLKFEKPKEWLEETREQKMKKNVAQEVTSEVLASLGSLLKGQPQASADVSEDGPEPGEQSRSRFKRPKPSEEPVRRPRRPRRKSPSISSLVRKDSEYDLFDDTGEDEGDDLDDSLFDDDDDFE